MKLFFALAFGTLFSLCSLAGIYILGISSAHVTQNDWSTPNLHTASETLSESLPESATKFCFARSSVGLGGRFMAYAVDGTKQDLNEFAEAEYEAHWDKPAYTVTANSESPFTARYIAHLEHAYSVDLDWLREASGKTGNVYSDAKEQGSHMPTIFVDEDISVLYFVMSD